MSRTYRRLKLKKPIKRLNATVPNWVKRLSEVAPNWLYLYNTKYKVNINDLTENNKMLKKEIALDFKDGTSAIWNVRGPHHFHNMKERRHRAECRDSIHKYIRTYNMYNEFKKSKCNRIEYINKDNHSFDNWIEDEAMFIFLYFPELDNAEPVLRSKPTREYWF